MEQSFSWEMMTYPVILAHPPETTSISGKKLSIRSENRTEEISPEDQMQFIDDSMNRQEIVKHWSDKTWLKQNRLSL